ncbi:MAG: hypothetical protein WCS99_15045, partial [Limisphaerales bacterium]
ESLKQLVLRLEQSNAKLWTEIAAIRQELRNASAGPGKDVPEINPPAESDVKELLVLKIKKESEGRISMVSFRKFNGHDAIVNGLRVYTFEYEAVIQFLEARRWRAFDFGGAWNGSFYTIGEPRDALQGVLSEFGTSPKMTKGQRKTVGYQLPFELTEKGWRSQEGLILPATVKSKDAPAPTATAAASPTRPDPPKSRESSKSTVEVRFSNETFSLLDVYFDDSSEAEKIKGQQVLKKKFEENSQHTFKSVGPRGAFQKSFKVQGGMRAIRIENTDFKK